MADNAPIDVDQFIDNLRLERGRELRLSGKVFHLVPPELMSDEAYEQFAEIDDADVIAQARLMIDDYDGFVAAGGSAMILCQIVAKIAEDEQAEQGATPGESAAS